MPKMAAFVETFDGSALDPAKWRVSYTKPTEPGFTMSGGKITFNTAVSTGTPNDNYRMWESHAANYDLIGSSFVVSVDSLGAPGKSAEVGFTLAQELGATFANAVTICISLVASSTDVQVYAARTVGGTTTEMNYTTVARTAVKFLRLRESGGSCFWDYAASSSGPWTQFSTLANPITLTALYPHIWWGRWDTTGTDSTLSIAGINDTPVPPMMVQSYASALGTDVTPKSISGIAVQAGDLLVVTAKAADGEAVFGTPTGGTGLTWTQRTNIGTSGVNSEITTWSAPVTSAQTVTLSVSRTSSTARTWGFSVKVWRGSAGIGAVNTSGSTTSGASGTLTLTTTGENSAIDLTQVDWDVTSTLTWDWRPGAGAFTQTIAPTQYAPTTIGQYSLASGYYADSDLPGAKVIGASAPGMRYTISGVEVLGSTGTSAPPVSTRVEPEAVPGLVNRWVAADLALANNTVVQTFTSRTGGVNLTQATSGSRPTYVTSSGALGSKPALRFDGTADFMQATVTSDTQPHSIVIVAAPTSVNSLRQLFAGSTDGAQLILTASAQLELYGGTSLLRPGATTAAGHVYIGGFSGSSSFVTLDGAARTTGNGGTLATGTTVYLGRHGTTAARYFPGDIAEVMIYDHVLTLDEQSSIDSYVQDTYGITVADYVSAAPVVTDVLTATATATATVGGTAVATQASEHASTPPVVRTAAGWTGSTIVSDSFVPPAPSILLATVNLGYAASWAGNPPEVTLSDNTGLTWFPLGFTVDTTSQRIASGSFYAIARVSTPTTVTATRTSTGAAAGQLAVRVLSDAVAPILHHNAVLTGATVNASASAQGAGSILYAGAAVVPSTALAPVVGFSELDDWENTTDKVSVAFGRSTATTTGPTSTAYGWTGTESGGSATFVAGSADWDRNTTDGYSVTIPNTIQAGDLMLTSAIVDRDSINLASLTPAQSLGTPNGWTALGAGSGHIDIGSVMAWAKVAVAGDAGTTVLFPDNTPAGDNDDVSGAFIAFRNVQIPSPLTNLVPTFKQNTTSTATVATATGLTAPAGAVIVNFFHRGQNTDTPSTGLFFSAYNPAAMVEAGDSGATSHWVASGVAYQILTAAITTATDRTASMRTTATGTTTAQSRSIGVSLALTPVPAASLREVLTITEVPFGSTPLGPISALEASASVEAVVGPLTIEGIGALQSTASASAAITAPLVRQLGEVAPTASATASVGAPALVTQRGALTARAVAAPAWISGVGAPLTSTATAAPTVTASPLMKPAVIAPTAAVSATDGGIFFVQRSLAVTAAATPSVLTNTIRRVGALAPVARALVLSYALGQASLVVTAAGAPAITTVAFDRRSALVATAAGSPTLAGTFITFKAFTSTAAAAPRIVPVVTPVVFFTGRAVVVLSGFSGASVPLTATARAAPAIGPLFVTVRGVLASTARATPTIIPLIRHLYGVTATAQAVTSNLGFFFHKLRERFTLDFGVTGTLSPLPERFSTVQIRVDTAGSPGSVTGMTANATLDFSGDQSVVTLGPPARFSVSVTATGRISFITELQENITVTTNVSARLRTVQSLTTILENGLPALVTAPQPPPSKLTVPEPEPEPERAPEPPAAPVYDRVFMNVRR